MGFDPISLATIGKWIGVAGSVAGTVSSINAASYQASVAQRNQEIAERNSRKAIEDSQREQQDWSVEAGQQLAGLLAEQSASGISLSGGSSFLRRKGAEDLTRRDASRIREGGNIRSQNFSQQAADFGAEAGMERSRRKFSLLGGGIDAASSYISGASSVNRARGLIS